LKEELSSFRAGECISSVSHGIQLCTARDGKEEASLHSGARQHQCSFFFGRLADVRRADVQRYVTHRSTKISAGSVLKELNLLKDLFALAID